MASLVETLKQREAERKRAADDEKSDATRRHRELLAKAKDVDSYRELLARQSAPGAGDAAALETLMATLGITLADLEADLVAVAAMQRARAGLKTEEEIATGEEALAAARADEQAVEAEKRQAIADIGRQVPAEWLDIFLSNFDMFLGQQSPFYRLTCSSSRLPYWNARRSAARAATNEVKYEHGRALRRIEQLEEANPRVFGGAEAVEEAVEP